MSTFSERIKLLIAILSIKHLYQKISEVMWLSRVVLVFLEETKERLIQKVPWLSDKLVLCCEG